MKMLFEMLPEEYSSTPTGVEVRREVENDAVAIDNAIDYVRREFGPRFRVWITMEDGTKHIFHVGGRGKKKVEEGQGGCDSGHNRSQTGRGGAS